MEQRDPIKFTTIQTPPGQPTLRLEKYADETFRIAIGDNPETEASIVLAHGDALRLCTGLIWLLVRPIEGKTPDPRLSEAAQEELYAARRRVEVKRVLRQAGFSDVLK